MTDEQELQVHSSVVLVDNPWHLTIPDDDLGVFLEMVARKRAEHIERQFAAGRYDRDNLAIAIMNPMAPPSVPSNEALLAVLVLGEHGEQNVVPAIAGGVFCRDFRRPVGYGAWLDPLLSGDGHPRRGASVVVNDTCAGTHGLRRQDAMCEAGHALVSLNWYVAAGYFGLRTNYQHTGVYTGINEPDQEIIAMAALPDIRSDLLDEDDTSEHDAVS